MKSIFCSPCNNHGLVTYKKTTSIAEVAERACDILGADLVELIEKCRQRERVEPRQMIMVYLCSKKFTVTQIGYFFNRHHSTVVNARSVVNDLCFSDSSYKEKYLNLFEKLEMAFT